MKLAITLITLAALAGCQSAEQKAAIQAAQNRVTAVQQQAKVDAAKAKAAADAEIAKVKADAQVKVEQAKNSPISHPIASLNYTVQVLRDAALPVAIVSGIMFALSLGAYFWRTVPLVSAIGGIGMRVFGYLELFALAEIFLLPFVPWLVIPLLLGFIAIVVYELIHAKGNIAKARQAVEVDLGIPGSVTAPIAVTPPPVVTITSPK